MLPRPFSLYDRAADGSRGSFLIKAVGPGTRALVDQKPGERVHLTGPLGQPFSAEFDDPVCVAGGVGLAPFLLLARERKAAAKSPLRLLFGGRNRPSLAGMEVGAGVLAWTAAKMMMSEPLIKDYFVDQVALSLTVYAVVIGGVLGAGMLVNRRHMGQHADAHVVDLAAKSAAVSDAGT